MTFSPVRETAARESSGGLGGDGRPRVRRMIGPFKTAGVLGLAALALHWRDPHSDGAWGKCPSLYLFGIACPLCGGLRAVNDLTNGHVVEAFWSNALFISVIPLVVLWWFGVARDRWQGSARPWTWPLDYRWSMPTLIAILAAFAVVRNTPMGASLYP